jgi:hypothetical protein
MLVNVHQHGQTCDCAAHRTSGRVPSNSGIWSAILPALACATCPACVTTYAKLLSVLGVGLGLSEFHHFLLLAVAIGASISVSAWRSWRTHRAWPIAAALVGSCLVTVGHFAGDLHGLEWAGILTLLSAGLFEHFRFRHATTLARSMT